MKREFATYEVTGYDDLGKIKFVHLREGEFVLPVEIKGDDLRKIKKMMERLTGIRFEKRICKNASTENRAGVCLHRLGDETPG